MPFVRRTLLDPPSYRFDLLRAELLASLAGRHPSCRVLGRDPQIQLAALRLADNKDPIPAPIPLRVLRIIQPQVPLAGVPVRPVAAQTLVREYGPDMSIEQNDGRLGAGNFTQRLARIRFNLAFTPEISWTNVLQYDNVTDSMGLNSIFRWEIESGREFFLVLNHGWLQENSSFHSYRKDFGVKVRWTFRF